MKNRIEITQVQLPGNPMPSNVRAAVESLLQPYGIKLNPEPVKEQPSDRRYLDVRAATKYTSLSRWTLSRAVSAGELSCMKMSPGKTGKILFDVGALDRFVKGHAVRNGGTR
jgi:hypothetical protein